MLASLRFDGFSRRDDEQHDVDSGGSGQHVAHEALVSGDVHEPEPEVIGDVQVRETEVDGDAAPFLFREAVGIDAGERFDERGFVRDRCARRCRQ